MNKISIIIQREFSTRVKKKSFILLTLLMPFVFAALVFVPLWLSTLQNGEQKTVYVVDKTGRYVGLFKDNESFRFVPQPADSTSYYAEGSGVEAVVLINNDLVSHPRDVSICSPKAVSSELLRYTEDVLGDQVRRDKLEGYNVPELDQIIADVQSDFSVRTVIKNDSGQESTSSTHIAMAAGFLLTFLIYLFVMSYGAMVMQSVMEEKTNRIVELMVSSVKPFQLMMGKIIGVALVGLLQLLIWGILLTILIGICGSLWSPSLTPDVADPMMNGAAVAPVVPTETVELMSGILNLPYVELVLMFCLYFVGGYLLYAAFFAAVGASVNAQEDSSQFVMPVVLIMIFGLYAGMYSVENTNGPLAFWASMFPLTSPIVMMVRIPFGVPLWQEVLSLGILFATCLAFVWLSGRIYRVGILLYGKKPNLREMLRWIRYK
jgi:ABC-2 type transport system permease protein